MPSAAPAAFVQTPPQHSAAVLQTSLFCTQNDGFEQMPLLQNCDAQSPLTAQGLPEVGMPPGFSGVHFPPPSPSGPHVPPQHSALFPHAWLSATQSLSAHFPPMHENVQHSLPFTHVVPGALQSVLAGSHLPLVVLQLIVQHSVLFVHAVAVGLQVAASGSRPPSMVLMKPSPPLSAGVEESTPGPASGVEPPRHRRAPLQRGRCRYRIRRSPS